LTTVTIFNLVKNVIKTLSWAQILNYIFNPTFGFVHISLKFGFKQPSIILSVFATHYS